MHHSLVHSSTGFISVSTLYKILHIVCRFNILTQLYYRRILAFRQSLTKHCRLCECETHMLKFLIGSAFLNTFNFYLISTECNEHCCSPIHFFIDPVLCLYIGKDGHYHKRQFSIRTGHCYQSKLV